MMTTQELVELEPDSLEREDLLGALKHLNTERSLAGRLDNGITGYLQHGAVNWMFDVVRTTQTWRDFDESIDDDAYQKNAAKFEYHSFPEGFVDCIRVVAGLNDSGRQETATLLDKRDPDWRDVALDARRRKLTAQQQMRLFMDALLPGFREAVDEIRSEGSITRLVDFARAETGFRRLPPKIMQGDAYRESAAETWNDLVNQIAPYQFEGAITASDVVLGYAAVRLIQKTPPEDILPQMLTADVRRMAGHTRYTIPGLPFDSFSRGGKFACDYQNWVDDVRRASPGTVKEGSPDITEHGKCPLQHPFVGDVKAILAYSQRQHGVMPGFNDPPTIGEGTMAAVILAAGKEGGPLHPASEILRNIPALEGSQ